MPVCLICAYAVLRDVSPQSLSLITGSVEQMKAKNKFGLYLVGAGCVTVSSGFILGVTVHPKLYPQSEAATGLSEQRPEDMWPLLMSEWFNIRSDLYQASVTC